jgi:hypothetical protein
MIFSWIQKYFFCCPAVFLAGAIFLFSACSGQLGYGILLWASDEPAIPSGTVLPVYIRSNINRVWVAGIPQEYRDMESKIDKFEIPLEKLEFAGSKKKAAQRAEEFAPYALTYAETLQDGLPIRENPDNGARRVYRLKLGEIIKILSPAEGSQAVGTRGDPLPGQWFYVLTEEGVTGYCFSYRLKTFEHSDGMLASAPKEDGPEEDPELERLLSLAWQAEAYGTMVNNRRINLEELSLHWGFDPGEDSGIAHIKTREYDRTFSYSRIRPTGARSWRFEGTSLQMNLRSDTTLAVQFTETGGLLKTLLFVALPADVDDLIVQETARRQELYATIFSQGPVFTSHNYGTITFLEEGRFTWTGNNLLIPQIIPAAALGSGTVQMRLFLSQSLSQTYSGAVSFFFNSAGGSAGSVNFMYSLDSSSERQGFRLEYIPDTSLDDIVVARRSSSPLVLYFFKAEAPVLPSGIPDEVLNPENLSGPGTGNNYFNNYDDYDYIEGFDDYQDTETPLPDEGEGAEGDAELTNEAVTPAESPVEIDQPAPSANQDDN